MVLFDQGTYDKLLSEAPKFKLITPSILSDRLRVWLAQSHLACMFTSYKYACLLIVKCGPSFLTLV